MKAKGFEMKVMKVIRVDAKVSDNTPSSEIKEKNGYTKDDVKNILDRGRGFVILKNFL